MPMWIVILIMQLAALIFLSCFGGRTGETTIPQEEELHYGIVLDAGSSGTRAYIYYWPSHSGNHHDLLNLKPVVQDGEPLVKKVSPGLSSQGENPTGSFEYLRPLLDFAAQYVPKDKHKETPLYILATAGMRLIEKQQQTEILENVKNGIKLNYQFYFPEGHLEIISGKQEGIYQWLAINYVLGKFKHYEDQGENTELVAVEHSSGRENLIFRPRTVGALDMGGASMQVALEITSNLQLQDMSEKEKSQIAEINLGCLEHDKEHTYRVFVTTFLGYGANEARARHQRNLFLQEWLKDDKQGVDEKHRIKDPCRAIGMQDNVTINLDLENLNISSTLKAKIAEDQKVYFYGTGDWDTCYSILTTFTQTAESYMSCTQNCPDSGISPPPIQFDNSEFFGFSEFWYSMDDVLGLGGQYMYNKYKTASKNFCTTRWRTTWARFLQGVYPNSDSDRLNTQCFKSAWVSTVLHQGLLFPFHYGHLTAAPNTVQGEVVHWTLGALLYRTRYLPLRSIENIDVHHAALERGYMYSPYIIWLCLLIVIFSIVLYISRLRRYVKPSTLRKVPSMIFSTPAESVDEARMEEGENLLRREQDRLYAHTKVFVG